MKSPATSPQLNWCSVKDRRDIRFEHEPGQTVGARRRVIAVIGIDRYPHWPTLHNAVRDAEGAAKLFHDLGFEQITPPLLDDRATSEAIRSLVTDDLKARLGREDSLVLFYAGHGSTQDHPVGDHMVRTGHLVPSDAPPDKVATWIELDSWLSTVSRLPAKHILVVLDACHSGIALNPGMRSRAIASRQDQPPSKLAARRSRKIITSALDDEFASDGGPFPEHSLFTGCLIQRLRDEQRDGRRAITGTELGLLVRDDVKNYPRSRQTPDFGTFDHDDRGEMEIPLVLCPSKVHPAVKDRIAVNAARKLAPSWKSSVATSPSSIDRGVWYRGAAACITLAIIALLTLGYRASQRAPDGHPVDAGDAISTVPDNAALVPDATPAEQLIRTQPGRSDPDRCPPGMLLVPAGTFRMGTAIGAGDDDERPVHEVMLTAYCIDSTEVTVKAYAACVQAGGCTAAPLTVRSMHYSSRQVTLWNRFCNGVDRPDHPINCVDWYQANAYCKWAGHRLPTEAEWEYAARGGDERIYPWGNEAPSAKHLNACGPECAALMKRNGIGVEKTLYDDNDGWETTAPVGSFPAGASPFGALDMAGNVWEWTADWYGSYAEAAALYPRGASAGTARLDRGGAWNNFEARLIRAANRGRHTPTSRFNIVGFRCASDDRVQ